MSVEVAPHGVQAALIDSGSTGARRQWSEGLTATSDAWDQGGHRNFDSKMLRRRAA
jgi:hypothetical protein